MSPSQDKIIMWSIIYTYHTLYICMDITIITNTTFHGKSFDYHCKTSAKNGAKTNRPRDRNTGKTESENTGISTKDKTRSICCPWRVKWITTKTHSTGKVRPVLLHHNDKYSCEILILGRVFILI